MMWWVYPLLMSLGVSVGIIPPFKSHIRELRNIYHIIMAVYLTTVFLFEVVIYLFMIPQFKTILLIEFSIAVIVGLLFTQVLDNWSNKINIKWIELEEIRETTKKWLYVMIVIFLLTLTIPYIKSYSEKYKVANDVFQPISDYDVSNFTGEVKIVTVPYYTAVRHMGVALNEFGTIYKVSDADYQLINGTLYWVGSVAYDGFFRQLKYKDEGIPVVSIMNAEKPEDAKLVKLSCNIKYALGNYFGLNINRYIWKKYPNYGHTVPVLQLHNNHAYYVSMLLKYVGWTSAKKPYKLVIVDACTGSTKLYDLDKVPDWVTFIHQEDEIEEYVYAWGVYKHGLWNIIYSHKDLMYPTGNIRVNIKDKTVSMHGSDVWMIIVDGKPYWFTAYRPPGNDASKNTMIGLALIDAKTGKMIWIRTPNYYNDYAIMENVLQSPEVSKSVSLVPSQPYPIFKNNTIGWFVPILGTNAEIQMYAIGDAKTGRVYIAETPEEVLKIWSNMQYNSDTQHNNEENTNQTPLYWVIIERANGTIERIPIYDDDKIKITKNP